MLEELTSAAKFDRRRANFAAAGYDERELTHRTNERDIRVFDVRRADG